MAITPGTFVVWKCTSLGDDVGKIVSNINPLLAGLYIFGLLASIYQFGAVGNWVLTYWVPLTRHLWEQFFVLLPWNLNISDVEKDSLTGVLFLVPLAVRAELTPVPESRVAQFAEQWPIFGWLLVFAMAFLVARQPLLDFSGVDLSGEQEGLGFIVEVLKALLEPVLLPIALGVLFLPVFLVANIWVRSERVRRHLIFVGVLAPLAVAAALSLSSWDKVPASIFEYQNIGPIRFFSGLLVGLSLFAMVRNQAMVLRVAAFVVLMVISSYLWKFTDSARSLFEQIAA